MGDEQRAEATEPRRRGPFLFVLMAVMAVLLYVLSIWPAVFVYETVPSSRSTIRVVAGTLYAPLEWLYHNTALKKPLETYSVAWERSAESFNKHRSRKATSSTSSHP